MVGNLILGSFDGVFRLIALAVLVVKVWALVDAAVRPSAAYQAAVSQSKKFWLVILALALVFAGIGILGVAALVAAIVYLVDVRPKLREVRGGRDRRGPYDY